VSIQLNRTDREDGTQLEKRKEGDCFGEEEFFNGARRSKTVKSLEFISLFSIKREDFLTIIAESLEDYQKYCMIRVIYIYS
jgi:CRP-like cAMP-binding protein